MAGHSKWANIKHKKGRADAVRGKVFSKLAKEMTVAARSGGGDPDSNITLRMLVGKAKAANMPNDNIERAIKKGTGELEGGQLEECVYEAYAAGGIGLIIEALTDNKNRAASEIKNVLTKNGANLAQQGAVSRMFQRKGQILVDAALIEEEKLLEIALEAGAEDINRQGDQFEILADPGDYPSVNSALEEAEIKIESSEVAMLPDLPTEVKDRVQAEKLLHFVELLEDLDDVQNVYPAFDINDAVLAEIEGG
jgi:YebC/PmpR family DNA-binding regulatory protein